MGHEDQSEFSPSWLKRFPFLSTLFDLSEPNEGLDKALIFNKSLEKRAFDLIISIPALIIFLPVFLIIGLLIKIESKGPIIFTQDRVGKNGRIFKVYKFRSMFIDADENIHKDHILAYKLDRLDPEFGYKIKNDPRITKIGKFLRDTSLDEIPQLINVIRGEMSLVGPRPVPIYEADLYDLWQSERILALPGITGLWQVKGRSIVSFEEQIRLDIHYVRHQSLWFNIKILIATVLAVFNQSGAG